MTVHKSVLSRALKAAKAAAYGTGEYLGFCVACGRKACGIEPDARKLECASCHAKKIYGAEELVMMFG